MGIAEKIFQGHSSKVKVTATPNALLRQRHTFLRCNVEDHSLGLSQVCIFVPVHHNFSSYFAEFCIARPTWFDVGLALTNDF